MIEHQLLLSQDEAIEKKLIEGTDQYYYYSFLGIFNKHGYNLTEKQQHDLDQYLKKNTDMSKKIALRSLFLKYYKLTAFEQNEEIEKFIYFTKLPTVKNQATLGGLFLIKQSEFSSKIDESILNIESYLEQAYSESGFYKIKQPLYSQLNPKKLINLPIKIIKTYLNNIGNEIIEIPDIPCLFCFLLNQKEFNNEFTQAHFRKLSLQQMEEIAHLNQKFLDNQLFVGELFLKKFQTKHTQLAQEQEIEKLEVLQQLRDAYDWTSNLSPKFKSFNDSIHFELLQIGLELNEYNFDLFFEFLKSSKQEYSFASNESKAQRQNQKSNPSFQWQEYHQLNTERWVSTDELIEKYLQKYFEKDENYEIFEQYFEKKYLDRVLAQGQLYKGHQVENVQDYFSSVELEKINLAKSISICTFNKLYFSNREQVKLFVELKNIPKLNIKIFQFNTENYYLSKQKALDSEINLEGLIAFEEINFSYSYPPIQKFIKEFEFDSISKCQKGVFIIEFIGNGITSRAIIKKGRLQLRGTTTAAGHRFQILDENFCLCSGEKTGIWIDKKFYKTDQHRQEVLVPFGSKDEQFNAIIVHQNYAELSQVQIAKENYVLKCAFLVNDEQLLMGAQAKAVILSKLYINGIEIGLNLLEDQKISVISINDQGVPSTLPFDNLKLETGKLCEIQFPVAAKLKSIQIKVSGKVKRMHLENDKKEEYLEQSHEIIFDNWQGQIKFYNQYLKFDEQNGYQICIVGKNGEPKENLGVNIVFQFQLIDQQIQKKLITDEHGKVYLGYLKNIRQIVSNIETSGDQSVQQKQWQIQQSSAIQYPSRLTVLAGQQIQLPILAVHNEVQDKFILCELKGINEKIVVKNLTQRIQNDGQNIIFTLEKEGLYQLCFVNQNYCITINVLQGEFWKGSNNIRAKNQLIIDNSFNQMIVIQNLEKLQVDDGTKIKGQISSSTKPYVLAYATSFVNQNFDFQINQLAQIMNKSCEEKININLFSSVFQSNKELSDEQKYVLNRKTQERYVGNTLDKPQILLQRQLLRETTTQDEHLNKEGLYEKPQEDQIKCKEPRKLDGQIKYSQQSRQQSVTTFQDFLQHPAQLFSNINLDEQNQFEIEIPQVYSTVVLLVFNDQSFQHCILPLNNQQILTRNLSHQSTLEKNKFYSIDRYSNVIKQNEPLQIQDLTSADVKLVDSLDKLFIILRELRQAKGNESDSKDFQKWEFLVKWHLKSIEEKHSLYNQHQTDELNLFIYFKDFAYFKTYTENYIRNKIEKSFIDYVLLQDETRLKPYCSMVKLKELNALEQVLLIWYLSKSNQMDEAQQIAKFLENLNKMNLIDQEQSKKYFDTVLGAKIESGPEIAQSRFPPLNQPYLPPPPPPPQAPLNRNPFFFNMSSGIPQNASFGECPPGMGGQGMFAGCPPPPPGCRPSGLGAPPPPMACPSPYQIQANQNMPQFTPPQLSFNAMDQLKQQIQQRKTTLLNSNNNNNDSDEDEGDQKICNTFTTTTSTKESKYYAEKRQQFIENFKNVEKTKEYCEKHYSEGTLKENFSHLIKINGFFVDFANFVISQSQDGFLSSQFIFCNNNQTEMIVVLALMDLPFEAPIQEYKQLGGKGLEIKIQSSALFFKKEIKEGKPNLRQDILITQRFFDPLDKFEFSEDDLELKLEKDVKEFRINKIYGCQIIVTNCSSTNANFQVLVEIPNGAIPINTMFYTKSFQLNFQPYSTQRIEYFFYFPQIGQYSVYPANVSRQGKIASVAQETQLTVVAQKSIQKLEAIDDILAIGHQSDILNFLETKNIFNKQVFQPENIYYLLKDKQFYLKVMEIYRKRKFFDLDSLKFSIYHNDKQSLIEFFSYESCQEQLKSYFTYFKCSLFEVSNIRMLEYYPLVTKRVHKLTNEAKDILNVEFRNQYKNYLTYLIEKPIHSLSDKLGFIYYLLLQERINEAIQIYNTITQVEEQGEGVLQYDYFTAYLDFYIGYPNFIRARQICEKYLNYPIIQWRNLFYEIVNLLAEYDGDDDENANYKIDKSQKQKQQDFAKQEETIESSVEGNSIILTYSNLSIITLQFYIIDLEILFSRNPFLNQTDQDFTFVLPNQVLEVKLEEEIGLVKKKIIPIPEELQNQNLFLQVKGTTKRTINRYYSTLLNVQVMENYGQIRVSDSKDKYLPKIYVKVYVKDLSGKESFYKDGYTDLRGRFDYASLSSGKLDNIQKFALLITSDEYGSIIKEVNPPSQVGRYESEVKLVSKNWNDKAQQIQVRLQNEYEVKKNCQK